MRLLGPSNLAVFLLFALAASVEAQSAGPMTIVDLIEVPSLANPELSPDGTQVLFVRTEPDWDENRTIAHVWRVDSDGGDPVQLTTGKEGQSRPLWSPNGEHIAFLAERGEEEATQIHLLNSAGGEAVPLTEHPTAVGNIEWSPDGVYIYFTATDEKTEEAKARDEAKDDVFALDEDWRHRHLWRVAVASGETEQITRGDFTISGYALSVDGTRIAHHRAPNPLYDDSDEAEVWVMDADGGDGVRITANAVPEGVGQEDPRVPMPQSVEMYRAVKANGVPTHLYVAPREGHGWRELRHRLFLANVQIEWFERWVMDREWTWEEVPDEAEDESKQVAAGSGVS